MSRKYIAQVDSLDFVYPNNFTAEYDLEIVHDINNNCVSGVTTVFSATTINSTGITFNIQGSWSLNGAEPYININGGFLSLASIHMMGPTQSYYRPWRLVDNISSTGLTNTNVSFNENFTVLPSYLGLTGFTTGTYYFEVRMIGKKCVYPICVILSITVIASTPTPTPTRTSTPTPTPTITPTTTTTPTPTPTIPSLTTYTGCGYGVNESATCLDAENNRTLYSDCNSLSFGAGCYVFVDTFPNPLTGYNFVQINGATWAINSITGQITGLAGEQC